MTYYFIFFLFVFTAVSLIISLKKKYAAATVFLLLGMICMLIYRIIGSKVAPDGELIEPFFLITLGYVLIFIGIITTSVMYITAKVRQNNIKKREEEIT